ncbi:MAG: family 78 glycoside hydrolase catalytic domain [Actinomycetia bacterium]|nr:family 78 glycoside hydrolase catalytic domain [Actinomycetes bacterium]
MVWAASLGGAAEPRFSWVASDRDRDEQQSAYRLKVWAVRGGLVWDSGKVGSDRSTMRPYEGPPLESGKSYTWRVRVWDAAGRGSKWSARSTLHTGLLSLDDWHGSWLKVSSRQRVRTEFELDAPVKQAVLYVAAQGSYTGRLNGERLTDERLANTWTDWDRRTLYRGIDVSDMLVKGTNAIGFTVAAAHSLPAGSPINLTMQLEVVAGNGARRTVLTTGEGWVTAPSPVTRVETFLGEDFDARLETTGWDEAGFDDSAWEPAVVRGPVVGERLASQGAAVTAKDSIEAAGWSRDYATDGILVSTDASQGYHSEIAGSESDEKWVQIDLGEARPISSIGLHPANPTNDPAGTFPGIGFPVRYRVETSNDPDFTDPEVFADRTATDQPNPGTEPVVIDGEATARYVRVTATKLRSRDGSAFSFRLAELAVHGADERGFTLTRLEPDPTSPMRVVETVAPVEVTEPKPGVRLYDFGQNYAGWVQLAAAAPAGTTAKLHLGEILDDSGRVTTANINFRPGEPDRQVYRYTFAGSGTETWEPSFVYSGFRYAELTGVPDGVEPEINARVVHTDLQRRGSTTSSDPLLNRISGAVERTQLNAMHGLPEDTPTREKKGWTGDALSGVSSIMSSFDADTIYRKYLGDIQTSIFRDGGVPSVVPTRQFGRLYKVDPAWGAAYPEIAWTHYLNQGDKSVLRKHYEGLVGWVDYLGTIADRDHVVVDPEVSYGADWQAIESTSIPLFHTGYYYRSTQILADIARELDRPRDADRYRALATEIANGLNRRFLDSDAGTYANGSQFANAFPLFLDIVPKNDRAQVLASLILDIREHDNHLTTGFVGTQPVIRALHDAGRDDVVLDIAQREDYPSLGYMVEQGPGTIWEKWVNSKASDGTSSKDHPALGGGMAEWFYQGMAGIEPMGPGYRTIALKVPPQHTVTHAAGSVDTPQGTVSNDWTWTDDELDAEVEVPFGTTATLVLPLRAGAGESITEGGDPVLTDAGTGDVDGVTYVSRTDRAVTLELGSGTYSFHVDPPDKQSASLQLALTGGAGSEAGDITMKGLLTVDSSEATTVELSAQAPDGWDAEVDPATISTKAGISDVPFTVTVSPPDGADPGRWPVSVTATTPDGDETTSTASARVLQVVREWSFDTAGDQEGWTTVQLGDVHVRDGALHARTTGGDPQLEMHGLDVDLARGLYVEVRLASTSGGTGTVFWGTRSTPSFSAQRMATFPVDDGEEATHLATIPASDTTLIDLRVDPVDTDGGEIAIDAIRILRNPADSDSGGG